MIKVSVMYPNGEGIKFDMAYYLDKHIPMARTKLGAPLKGVTVEQGLGGGQPGSAAAYLAMGHLLLESVEAFQPLSNRMPRQSWATFPTTPIASL